MYKKAKSPYLTTASSIAELVMLSEKEQVKGRSGTSLFRSFRIPSPIPSF